MTGRQNGLCIVRRGHMGDVLLTEPIARVLRREYGRVALCTEFSRAAALLEVYDEIIPYERFLDGSLHGFTRVTEIVYEVYPGCHHFEGYCKCMGLSLDREIPRIRRGFPRLIDSNYGLIAPDTSWWIRPMRQWSRERFLLLRSKLEDALGIPFILLEPKHGFFEMLSLIENCSCFIGNDSGPAILSQCFGRPTFVVFGATRPDLILLDPRAVGIQVDVGCNGCKHFSRHTDIECATPICLEYLNVEMVFARVLEGLPGLTGANGNLPQSADV